MAIQEVREFKENLDYKEIPVNRASLVFQEFAMCPCVIGPTTTGNITIKGRMSEKLVLALHPDVWRKSFTVSLLTPSKETMWELLHWRQSESRYVGKAV